MKLSSRNKFGPLLLALLAGLFAGVSTVLQKYGLGDDLELTRSSILAVASNPWFLLGILCIVLSWALFIVALRNGKTSILFALMGGTTYISLEICSVLYLGEQPSLMIWLGILIIIAGVSLLGVGEYARIGGAAPEHSDE